MVTIWFRLSSGVGWRGDEQALTTDDGCKNSMKILKTTQLQFKLKNCILCVHIYIYKQNCVVFFFNCKFFLCSRICLLISVSPQMLKDLRRQRIKEKNFRTPKKLGKQQRGWGQSQAKATPGRRTGRKDRPAPVTQTSPTHRGTLAFLPAPQGRTNRLRDADCSKFYTLAIKSKGLN